MGKHGLCDVFLVQSQNENKIVNYSFRVLVLVSLCVCLHWVPFNNVYIDLKNFNLIALFEMITETFFSP